MYIVAKRELMFGAKNSNLVLLKLQILIFFVAALPSFSVNMKDADASVCQYSFSINPSINMDIHQKSFLQY